MLKLFFFPYQYNKEFNWPLMEFKPPNKVFWQMFWSSVVPWQISTNYHNSICMLLDVPIAEKKDLVAICDIFLDIHFSQEKRVQWCISKSLSSMLFLLSAEAPRGSFLPEWHILISSYLLMEDSFVEGIKIVKRIIFSDQTYCKIIYNQGHLQ